MVFSRLKDSSKPLFYGDSRYVKFYTSSIRRLTLNSPTHPGLRSRNSKPRSVYLTLHLSTSLRIEDPQCRTPSISSLVLPQTTKSDVLSGVSGVPHKMRFLDPDLRRLRLKRSLPLLSFATIAGLLRYIDKILSTVEISVIVLPPSTIPSPPESRFSADAALPLGSQHIEQFVILPPSIEMGLVHNLGLASLLDFKDPHLQLVSQPTWMWDGLVSLTNPLKMFGGFTGIFTEILSHSLQYLSCPKSLPMGSPGSSVPSLHLSSLRSVLSPDVTRRSVSKFIIVLLSCVAVRSGPEDATDFVSAVIRGADLALTSQFKVTNSQMSSFAMNLVSTPLSPSLELLSSCSRGLSSSISYVVLSYAWRVFNNSPFNCILIF